MEKPPLKVLVLCTGNSCRSIMAEALINHLGQGRYQAWSAGSFPTGYVHPKSIETLRKHGIDPGQPRSKSWDEFANQHFDVVVTVCDQAAGESCPLFHGKPKKLHWSTPDPAKASGSEADAAFDTAFFYAQRKSRGVHQWPPAAHPDACRFLTATSPSGFFWRWPEVSRLVPCLRNYRMR